MGVGGSGVCVFNGEGGDEAEFVCGGCGDCVAVCGDWGGCLDCVGRGEGDVGFQVPLEWEGVVE